MWITNNPQLCTVPEFPKVELERGQLVAARTPCEETPEAICSGVCLRSVPEVRWAGPGGGAAQPISGKKSSLLNGRCAGRLKVSAEFQEDLRERGCSHQVGFFPS